MVRVSEGSHPNVVPTGFSMNRMTAIHLLFVTMLLCGLSSCKKSTSLAPGKAGPSSPPAASPAPTGFQLLKHGKEYRVMLADQLKDAAKVTVFLLDHNMQG